MPYHRFISLLVTGKLTLANRTNNQPFSTSFHEIHAFLGLVVYLLYRKANHLGKPYWQCVLEYSGMTCSRRPYAWTNFQMRSPWWLMLPAEVYGWQKKNGLAMTGMTVLPKSLSLIAKNSASADQPTGSGWPEKLVVWGCPESEAL